MAAKAARRIVAAVIVLAALALVVPPFINVSRYRGRMAESLSRATGRPVQIGEVSLRLIPQPGFDMQNVEIGDDPAFSNEPMLRAERVTAALRLSSLWRGRLEIAKLNLQYPSLNLVQSADGHWNLESLLWRASRTPVAPTGKRSAETRVRFPYIEVEEGRVNFSRGSVKSVFSFTEADVALFSPDENQWRIRLEAKPVRTDTNISDTGTVKADINFNRAEMLRDTQVQGKITWERGQLGMITKLIYGRDRGWRGALEMSSEVSGTPAELHFRTAAKVQDFRRFDVYAANLMTLGASCNGVASVTTYSMKAFRCEIPVAQGGVLVTGSFGPKAENYDVGIAAENVPLNSLLNFARHSKKNLPNDLAASGSLNLAATLQKTDGSDAWRGEGTTTELGVRSALLKEPLTIKPLRFALQSPSPATKVDATPKRKKAAETQKLEGEFLAIAPFGLSLGAKLPATVDTRVTTEGYQIAVAGPVELEHMIGFARAIGVSVPKVTLRGDAVMNVAVSGTWKGLPEPAVNGTAKVTNGRAEIPGIAEQVVIAQSDVALNGNEFQLRGMQGQVGEVKFTGAATAPRHCEEAPCGPGLDLQFEDLDVAKLNALLNPSLKKQPWYKLFGSTKEESLLSRIYAVGRITAKKFEIEKLTGTKFYADFRLNNGDLLMTNVRAALLGGLHEGQWRADFTGTKPVYSGSGAVTKLNVAQLTPLLKTTIGTGYLSGRYTLQMSGLDIVDLAKSAEGNASFDWPSPTIHAFAASGHGPTKIGDLSGKLELKGGVLSFNDSRMTTPAGIYTMTGTAEGEKLALEFTSDSAAGYKVTGTLRAPEVAQTEIGSATERRKTEASLKK